MGVILRTKKINNGVSYYLDIDHKGIRSYDFLKIRSYTSGPKKESTAARTEKKRIAESIRAQREIELLSHGNAYTPQHIRDGYFFDFAQTFIEEYPKKDKRMIISARNKFKDFAKNDNLTFPQITPHLMERFKQFLISHEDLSGETPHNYFTRFKKILRSAYRQGLIKKMPTDDVKFSNAGLSDTFKKEVLSIEEIRQLSNTYCGNDEVKRAFLFACFTGLGMAELRVLTWSKFKDGRLKVMREKTGTIMDNLLSPTAISLMGEPKKPEDLVFNLKISDAGIRKNLVRWLKKAEIDKKISFYCARHSFAVMMLMNGSDLKSVADAMGHTDIKTTTKYLNHIDSLKNVATSKLPNL